MTTLFDRLKNDCADEWRLYTRHPFVEAMGDGTLPLAAFKDYLVQDYLFLIQFARAYALAIYKSRSLAEMNGALAGLKAILEQEMQLHVGLCRDWGLSEAELENTPEKTATIAYTRFVLEAGQAGDLLDLYAALAPCMIGYGEIGQRLAPKASDANPYSVWINEYASAPYQELTRDTVANLDALAADMLTPSRYPRLRHLFSQATLLEADFWQMGLDAAVEA